jgi:hypothetical protein
MVASIIATYMREEAKDVWNERASPATDLCLPKIALMSLLDGFEIRE